MLWAGASNVEEIRGGTRSPDRGNQGRYLGEWTPCVPASIAPAAEASGLLLLSGLWLFGGWRENVIQGTSSTEHIQGAYD